ncbi:hypothetical protein Hanom_Chr08g00717051 [Helianthus anomalus]
MFSFSFRLLFHHVCFMLHINSHLYMMVRGGPKPTLRWAGAPPGKKKFSANFRQKSRPHPLEFFVRTPWNFSTAPLKFFVRTP